MRTTMKWLAIALITSGASAQWSDDFNRPDGAIGGDWTEVSGGWQITSLQGAHVSSGVNEVLQHNSASLAYTDAVVELDVFAPGTSSQFSGVLIGLGGSDAIMVKIQDQISGTPGFSNIGIYHLTSATGYGAWTGTGTGFATLTAPFLSAHMTVTFPTPDVIQVDLDTDFDGLADQTYTKDSVLTLAANLGLGYGITGWGATALFDNFSVSGGATPPTSYCTAGVSSNGCVPALTASAQPSASFATPCLLTAANIEGQKSGMIFYGINNAGFTPLPWSPVSTSFFCVKSPVQRSLPQNSGGAAGMCDGQLQLDWNAFHAAFPGSLGAPFSAGDKAYAQAWYRDPPASRTTNLSDAVELTLTP